MNTETREMTALVVGMTAALVVLPACFVSPLLVLGSGAVMIASLPFMPTNR
jgi:hypothetical protein